jgi:hypothetical protein
MRDRWCSARAARSEYERIERFFNAETAKTGITRMYSLDDKKMINQNCVKEAIDTVSDIDVVKASAVTNENWPTESAIGKDECRIQVTSEKHTACLKQIVEAHEVFHSRACQVRTKMWQGLGVDEKIARSATVTMLGDTKFLLTAAQFASEEAASYTREIVSINAKWKQLQIKCAPTDFLAEMIDADAVGPSIWNNSQPDSSGRRFYKMFDPSIHPCPSRPAKSPSLCTLR